MKQLCLNYLKIPTLVLFTIFTVMIYNGSAYAGEESMKTNLRSMAELMSKFSKQLSSGKVEPKAQKKMGDILSRCSQMMQEMTGAGGSGMKSGGSDIDIEHRDKLEGIKKEWDPFEDTYDGN
jgi:hypothetical protein